MPTKKKTEAQPITETISATETVVVSPVVPEPTEKKEESKPVEPALCGHVDMHSTGVDGKLDHPSCTLPAGHAGDHHGTHKQKVERERFYERDTGKLLKIEYDILDADAWWNDAAGVPVSEIEPSPMPSRNKKGEILQMVEDLLKG